MQQHDYSREVDDVEQMTSREFNQGTGRAKRAARTGPVYITDRGRPAYVLLSFDDYARLTGGSSMAELLGEPRGIEDVEFEPPTSRELDVISPWS